MSSHISLYGDESVNNNIVCYAICVIPTNLVKAAEDIIRDLKKKFKIPENYFLHCKELFNGNERQRLNFVTNLENIKNLYEEMASKFKTANMLCCYADKRDIKEKEKIIDWGDGAKTELYYGDKELIHLCKNAAMIDVVRSKKDGEYSFYPDPDNNSTMRWNNKKKAKVNNQNYNIIVPAGIINYESPPDQMIRAKQINVTKEKPELIQLADLLAYSFAKAKTVQEYRDKDFFVKIIGALNPVSRTFTFG